MRHSIEDFDNEGAKEAEPLSVGQLHQSIQATPGFSFYTPHRCPGCGLELGVALSKRNSNIAATTCTRCGGQMAPITLNTKPI